jgi:hypothetical protein
VVDNINFAGHVADPLPPGLPTSSGLDGNGTGRCTKDPSGKTGWVNVSFTFDGTDQTQLPCGADSTGKYFLTGPFTLHDGSASAQVEAALTITTAYSDPWTRLISAELDLAEAGMKSGFRVADVQPELKGPDPGLCTSVADSCPKDVVNQNVIPPSTSHPLLDSLGEWPVPPMPSRFWVRVGYGPAEITTTACYRPTIDALSVRGTLDLVPEAIEVLASTSGADDVVEPYYPEIADLFTEKCIADDTCIAPPDDISPPDLGPNTGSTVQELDETTAVALGQLIESIGRLFTPGTDVPGTPNPTDAAPYMITARYKTPTGKQTVEAVGRSADPAGCLDRP